MISTASAASHTIRPAARDDRELDPACFQHLHAVPVADVEYLGLFAAVVIVQPAVGKNPVHVEDRKTHELCPAKNVFGHGRVRLEHTNIPHTLRGAVQAFLKLPSPGRDRAY